MRLHCMIGLIGFGAFFLVGPAPQDAPLKKEQKEPTSVTIMFTDKSKLTGVVLNDKIEFNTHAGKLEVKADLIKTIHFGPRMTLKRTHLMDDNLKLLESNDARDRELAQTKLLEMGPEIYPWINIKFADAEAHKRCQIIASKLKEMYPDRIRNQEPDILTTVMLTVKGEINESNINLKHSFLGELKIDVAHILSIHALSSLQPITVQGSCKDWLETEIELPYRQSVRIHAQGQIDLWSAQPGQYMAQPKGASFNARGNSPYKAGQLLVQCNGKIVPYMEGGVTVTGPGKLHVKVADSPWEGAIVTGDYRLTFTGE